MCPHACASRYSSPFVLFNVSFGGGQTDLLRPCVPGGEGCLSSSVSAKMFALYDCSSISDFATIDTADMCKAAAALVRPSASFELIGDKSIPALCSFNVLTNKVQFNLAADANFWKTAVADALGFPNRPICRNQLSTQAPTCSDGLFVCACVRARVCIPMQCQQLSV